MMRHWLKRVGTGLSTVLVLAGVVALGFGAVEVDAQNPTEKDLLMTFTDFEHLHARKGVLVVDVRSVESFNRGHIPGAMHVPVGEMAQRVAAVKRAAKKRLIVTYCSCPSEATSLRAARALSDAGVDAKALVGGFRRWVELGGVIEKSNEVVGLSARFAAQFRSPEMTGTRLLIRR